MMTTTMMMMMSDDDNSNNNGVIIIIIHPPIPFHVYENMANAWNKIRGMHFLLCCNTQKKTAQDLKVSEI